MKALMNKKTVTAVFLTAEAILCVLVQVIGGAIISFSAVALAFLFVLAQARRDIEYLFSLIALLFTLLADICLVLMDPINQLFGMIFFSVTQLSYFALILIREKAKRVRVAHIMVRAIALLAVAAITPIVLRDRLDAVAMLSALYYINLILNVIFAFILTRGEGKRGKYLLPIGLVLFALCDLFVGFAGLAPYFDIAEGTLGYFLANPPFNIAWLFYVPSQALLAVFVQNDYLS